MKKITASEIAISALSCALATLFLTVGIYSGFFLFVAYLVGSVALMLPLCQQSWRGYAFAYVSTCLLTLLFASFLFWDVLPFIVFFGLHPLLNELQLKWKINRWIAFAVKALWFDGTLYLVWRVLLAVSTTVPFLHTYIVPIILVGGTAIFFPYDYLMFKWRYVARGLVQRIGRK